MSALPTSPSKDGVVDDLISDPPRETLTRGAAPSVSGVDPLEALRSADHRPRSVVWREQLSERMRSGSSVAGALTAVRPLAVGLLFLGVAVAVGWRLLLMSDPPVEDSIPIVSRNAPSSVAPVDVAASIPLADGAVTQLDQPPAPVVIHVAGAVLRPGLVDGVAGWRVADAIEAAGGHRPAADLDRLNLAAFVSDGQRIFVPEAGEAEPVVSSSAGSASGSPSPTGPVNLNTADSALLETLPGVGPATAATIMAHRDTHGPFATVDSLVAVRGIGAVTVEQLRDLVVVG